MLVVLYADIFLPEKFSINSPFLLLHPYHLMIRVRTVEKIINGYLTATFIKKRLLVISRWWESASSAQAVMVDVAVGVRVSFILPMRSLNGNTDYP